MSTVRESTVDQIDQSLLTDFLDESSQLLDRLNEKILILDRWATSVDPAMNQECDLDLLNELFRAAHSIKGLSAMLGLSEINTLTHKIENILDAARTRTMTVTGRTTQVLFQSFDVLTGMIECLIRPEQTPPEAEIVIAGMQALLREAGVERAATSQADAEAALAAIVADQSMVMVPTPTIDPLSDVVDEAEISTRYLAIFIDETSLALDELTDSLLGDGEKTQATLLGVSHRIKGSAASIGLNRVAKLAHTIEDVLQSIRENKIIGIPDECDDLLLKCVDVLRVYVQDLKQGRGDTTAFGPIAGELLRYKTMLVPAPNVVTSTTIKPKSDWLETLEFQDEWQEQADADSTIYAGVVEFQPDFPLVGMKARLVFEKLCRIGTVFHFTPNSETCDAMTELAEAHFVATTKTGLERIREQLLIPGVLDATLRPLTTPTKAVFKAAVTVSETATPNRVAPSTAKDTTLVAPTPEAAKSTTQAAPTETLRVDIERLDQLMNLVGQLVINRSCFSRIGDTMKASFVSGHDGAAGLRALNEAKRFFADFEAAGIANDAQAMHALSARAGRTRRNFEELEKVCRQAVEARSTVNGLLDAVHQLDRVTESIQKSVMETRMVPIGPLFTRFKRVVRDVTRLTNKQIELAIRGEKTELDKRMIDELGDPLIHLVRNSADHGIESPAERVAKGKPATGVVTLDAFHRGNNIVIQVTDDGKGLDHDRIRAKAVEKGIVSASDAEKLTPQQIVNLIWEPGFSTAEQVTEISGRGMGMDIVRSKIEQLNGAIDVSTTPGQGSTFTIKLPLTLAIMPSLLARVSGDVFALPMETIVEIVALHPKDVITLHGRKAALVRGRTVSLVGLDELFQWNTPTSSRVSLDADESSTLIIVGDSGTELGIIVDKVIGESDIVIKSLAENYRNIPGISGASILGDGRVALILDSATLIDISARDDLCTNQWREPMNATIADKLGYPTAGKDLFAAAVHEAGLAMSRWTHGLVTMEMDEIRETPFDEALQSLSCGEEVAGMAILTLGGDIGGDLILAFDDENGREMAAVLLGRSRETTPEWTPLEISAVCETGNIIGCAYVNALTRALGVELIPSPPYFVQDYAACVLEQSVVSQLSHESTAMICRTVFRREGKALNWHLFFLPSPGLRREIERYAMTL